jgi:hypothetical protein
MSEFPHDNHLVAAEAMQPTALLVQADNDASALNAHFRPSAAVESHDVLEDRSPDRLADPTPAHSEAKSVASGSSENLSGSTAEVNEVCASRIPVPPPTKPDRQTGELYGEIKGMIARGTRLPDSVCALVAFWAISTWFPDALQVFPILAISGPSHEATNVLDVLRDLCLAPVLLASFKGGDLKDLDGFTLLIAEPLDNRTAALLGNLTNRNFCFVADRSCVPGAGSRAVYLGENPAIRRIQHSIYIDATVPALAHDAVADRSTREEIDGVRNRILAYRKRHLARVKSLEFNPRGLSSEANVIASALGRCIVESPELQMQLVTLLKPQAQQQIADRSDSDEALVVGAVLSLCHQDKGEVYVKEISVEVNRLLEARGETRQLGPEKVGHLLKRVSLSTRRLSQAGNGLTLDQVTKIRLHEIAAAYRGEDSIQEDENLHCPLCSKNELLGEVM